MIEKKLVRKFIQESMDSLLARKYEISFEAEYDSAVTCTITGSGIVACGKGIDYIIAFSEANERRREKVYKNYIQQLGGENDYSKIH